MDKGPSIRAMRAVMGVVAAASLLMVSTACSSSSAGTAAGTNPAALASPSSALVKTVADQNACQDVQKVFLQLATLSSHWNPTQDPFDTGVAQGLVPFVDELRGQARLADTEQFRVVVDRNADALGDLAAAVLSHHRYRVTAALAQSRTAYAALPGCAHRDGEPEPSASPATPSDGSSPSSSGAPSPSGARAVFAKDPGCQAARNTYARLGAVTSAWNQGADPFDQQTARDFRGIAASLQAAASSARHAPVRQDLRANGLAFRDLADAMLARDLTRVNAGVTGMQTTAVSLAALCPLT